MREVVLPSCMGVGVLGLSGECPELCVSAGGV